VSLNKLKGYVVKWGNSSLYFIDENGFTNVLTEKAVHTARQAWDLKAKLEKMYFGRFKIEEL
jgi:hypothetical protein